MHYLEIGGAETALIGLLHALDYSKYNVDLFLHSHRGEMMAFIPKEVNILPKIPAYAQIERPLKMVLKERYYRIALARIWAKMRTKWYLKRHPAKESTAGLQYVANAVTSLLPAINPDVEYDLAISFLQPHNFVLKKVRAKKKVCWIHTDYSVVDVNARQELPVWDSFDNIVSISDDVTKTFLQTFPSLSAKIVKIENILSPTLVRQRADEFEPEDFFNHRKKCIRLLSVGRFTTAKNYDNVPDICRRIDSLGITDLKWFIIGYGPDEQLIRAKIQEAGMDEHVILLGKKTNPYPYIKACDIYLQPSRYEGKSVTVREAQLLCKPVIITNYNTAASQVRDGIDGIIVPMDNQGCAEGIVRFIKDKAKQDEIIQSLKMSDYGNENEVEKLYKLV